MSKEKERIEDIPKLKSLKEDLEDMEFLRKYSFLFSLLGINPESLDDIFDKLPALKEETEKLLTTPDKFNSFFSCRGWIAHESMKFDLMDECVNYAEKNIFEKAEEKLADHFCSDDMKYKLHGFNAYPEFKIRYDIIMQARENTLQNNYVSAVPLLLIVIDGIVNDIDKNKGFFASGTEISAWDSMAAHKSGLGYIKDIFNKSRKKTTTEQIELPYRNGILHGRDLGFGNKIVTGKCWSTLIAIYDWITTKANNEPEQEQKKDLTLIESLKSFRESIEKLKETRKKTAIITEKVKKWNPRDIVIGKDVPASGNPKDYKEFSPEREAVQFLEYWKNDNYGYIAKQIRHFEDPPPKNSKTAGEIREILGDKKLLSFNLISIIDEAPSISEISIEVNYQYTDKTIKKHITLRLTCMGNNGKITVNDGNDNNWKFFLFILRNQLA